MSKNRHAIVQELHDLSKPELTFKELCDRYPDYWNKLQVELKSESEDQQKNFMSRTMQQYKHHQQKVQQSNNDPRVLSVSMPYLVRARMLMLALEDMNKTMQSGDKFRFGFLGFGGRVFSSLLLRKGKAKPASWFWTRFWWRILPSRKYVMPMAQGKGISCFYSKDFIKRLAILLGDRQVLEVGAGNGDLARFLGDRGVQIRATDDYSWERYINYPPEVEKMEAGAALNQYKPQAVICAFSPPNNNFESKIFDCSSVDLYIVIGSKQEGMCFNSRAYASQKNFEWQQNSTLAEWILPPNGEWVVHVFKRKTV